MGQYTEKIYSGKELKEKVTIRVLPEKIQVYPRFKELVTKELGSDVCFVTTSLWEAFLTAMDQAPPAVPGQLEIKFLRQNVQINIGCKILYQPKKARRTPGTPTLPRIEKKKNLFLPLVLDEWQTLEKQQKMKLISQMAEEGLLDEIIQLIGLEPTHPSVSTGAQESAIKKIWKRMENSMTNVSKWLKRLFRRK